VFFWEVASAPRAGEYEIEVGEPQAEHTSRAGIVRGLASYILVLGYEPRL